ncbi:MAG: hypothetical protein J6866_00590, partial [Victivallales bacterium]|nr:hypothetical protein [Victivallales bacterium]
MSDDKAVGLPNLSAVVPVEKRTGGRASVRAVVSVGNRTMVCGRVARPFAAVVPLGKHAMPREGRASLSSVALAK